jgi:hypothetical protein
VPELGQRERFADPRTSAPRDRHQPASPVRVRARSGLARHEDDLLDLRRIGRVAHSFVRGRAPGAMAGRRTRRPAATSSVASCAGAFQRARRSTRSSTRAPASDARGDAAVIAVWAAWLPPVDSGILSSITVLNAVVRLALAVLVAVTRSLATGDRGIASRSAIKKSPSRGLFVSEHG